MSTVHEIVLPLSYNEENEMSNLSSTIPLSSQTSPSASALSLLLSPFSDLPSASEIIVGILVDRAAINDPQICPMLLLPPSSSLFIVFLTVNRELPPASSSSENVRWTERGQFWVGEKERGPLRLWSFSPSLSVLRPPLRL
uniref:Uncharacterized protein n=1 Tax=Nelumbo nucifera TaxID=4432 RepID=A0A822YZL8_NELNU|nr:TPA_asm: hypothetical protein HUJ06_008601 [Nelumbo nucifera]